MLPIFKALVYHKAYPEVATLQLFQIDGNCTQRVTM